MKTKILILITLLCSVGWGANKYTVGAGGTYTYMSEAATASAAGDTLLIVGRVPHNNVRADLKTNTVIRSADMDCQDTIYVGNTDGIYMATGCSMKGVTVAYFDSTKSSARWLINSPSGANSILIDSCVLGKGWGTTTNRSGCRISNTTAKNTVKVTNTTIDSINFGYTETGKYFSNCYFTYGRPVLNGYDSLMYCKIIASGEIAPKADTVFIDHCYIRGNTEAITLDDVNARSRGIVVQYTVIDSSTHVANCPDGADSAQFKHVRVTRYIGTNGMNYQHSSGAVDSISRLFYENCSFWGNGTTNTFAFLRPNNSGVRISKCAIFRGAFGTVQSTEDTLDTLLSTATAYSDSFDVFTDTLMTEDPFTEVTDSIYMYNRHRGRGVRSNGRYSGWAKYLLNEKDTIRISATEMSMSCSTDVEYWFKDPIIKDSLMCILDITQDTINGPWTSPDSGVANAGETVICSTGTIASGQWFYRFRSHELNSYAVKDTTFYFAFTNSVTDDSTYRYISPTGYDSGYGSSLHPWKTFAYAYYNALPGDTVKFTAGTYTETSELDSRLVGHDGKSDSLIVFTKYENDIVTIVLDTSQSILIDHERDYWVFDGLNFESRDICFRLSYNTVATNNVFKNCNFKMYTGADNAAFVYDDGGQYNSVVNCNLFGPGYNADGVHNNTTGVIAFNAIGLKIKNNTIHYFPRGIYYKHGQTLPEYPESTYIEIDTNFIYNCPSNFMSINTATAKIRGNIAGPNTGPMMVFNDNGGRRGDRNLLDNNIFYGCRLSLNYDNTPGARLNTMSNNIFLKAVLVFHEAGEPDLDSNVFKLNVYVNDTIINRGTTYNLDGWQELGRDSGSYISEITFDTEYSDTTREYYNYTLSIDPPVFTVQPISDTVAAGGTVTATGSYTGTDVQSAWWYYYGGDSTYSTDSVFTKTVTAANNGDSAKWVLWNSVDTIVSNTIYFTVVYAVFDSLSTDSTKIYLSGNFLSGAGWSATLNDTALTHSDSSATIQVFEHSEVVWLNRRNTFVITDGTYTITLYIGRRRSTGNSKTDISLRVGL